MMRMLGVTIMLLVLSGQAELLKISLKPPMPPPPPPPQEPQESRYVVPLEQQSGIKGGFQQQQESRYVVPQEQLGSTKGGFSQQPQEQRSFVYRQGYTYQTGGYQPGYSNGGYGPNGYSNGGYGPNGYSNGGYGPNGYGNGGYGNQPVVVVVRPIARLPVHAAPTYYAPLVRQAPVAGTKGISEEHQQQQYKYETPIRQEATKGAPQTPYRTPLYVPPPVVAYEAPRPVQLVPQQEQQLIEQHQEQQITELDQQQREGPQGPPPPQPQGLMIPLKGKGAGKLLKLKGTIDKMLAKLTLGSSYVVAGEEIVPPPQKLAPEEQQQQNQPESESLSFQELETIKAVQQQEERDFERNKVQQEVVKEQVRTQQVELAREQAKGLQQELIKDQAKGLQQEYERGQVKQDLERGQEKLQQQDIERVRGQQSEARGQQQFEEQIDDGFGSHDQTRVQGAKYQAPIQVPIRAGDKSVRLAQ